MVRRKKLNKANKVDDPGTKAEETERGKGRKEKAMEKEKGGKKKR